jgi:acyl transferase domain-containing protein
MYENGTRIFVEVGPRGNLISFVHDILQGKDYLAVPSNVPHRSGTCQISHLVGLLAAHGVKMSLDYLYSSRNCRKLRIDDKEGGPKTKKRNLNMRLALELPTLQIASPSNLSEEAPSSQSEKNAQGKQASGVPEPRAGTVPILIQADGPNGRKRGTGARSHGKSRNRVMAGYMETMARFLDMQRKVMAEVIDRRKKSSKPKGSG